MLISYCIWTVCRLLYFISLWFVPVSYFTLYMYVCILYFSCLSSLLQRPSGIWVTAGAASRWIFILYLTDTFGLLFPSVVPRCIFTFFICNFSRKCTSSELNPVKMAMLWCCFILQQLNLQGKSEVLKRVMNVRAVTLRSLVVYLYQPKWNRP